MNDHDLYSFSMQLCAVHGVKKDDGKPALDLIDPFFEEEVAKVLTYGALKYPNSGECTCGARDADLKNARSGQKGSAQDATTKTCSGGIPSTGAVPSQIRRSGDRTTRTHHAREATEQDMGSRSPSAMRSLGQAAPSAGRDPDCVSITATPPEKSEAACATPATSASASLNARTDRLQGHSPTCGSVVGPAGNWRMGMSKAKVMAGVLRHCLALRKGEDTDPETGYSHAAHAACGLMFLFTYIRTGQLVPDDRWQK